MQRKIIIWLCMLSAYVAGFWTLPMLFLLARMVFPPDTSCPVSEQRWTPETGWQERCSDEAPHFVVPNNVAGLVGSGVVVRP